jgi:hypothetical protein
VVPPETASASRRLLSVAGLGTLAAFATLGAVVAPGPAGRPALAAAAESTVVAQANWIMSAQLPDGAIAVWPDRPVLRLVHPYLANFAAIGLARAASVTGDASYADAAWSYLRWYASAESPQTGYVTDYDVVGGTELVSTGTEDSTDAYAGTYLAAVWDTYSATGDLAALRSVSGGVAGALAAIASTQQPDGLTWATPSWHVAYLMDNVQVLGGLEAATAIERTLGNSSLEQEAAARTSLMESGIASLYDPAAGAYDWARQQNGWQHPTDWSNLYPDALEQVSAVEWGAVPPARAAGLMAHFSSSHPNWDQPNESAPYLNGASVELEKISYWPSVAIALEAIGSPGAAQSGLSNMLQAAGAANYGWPYTTGDAGETIIAASGGQLLASTAASTAPGVPSTRQKPPQRTPGHRPDGQTTGQLDGHERHTSPGGARSQATSGAPGSREARLVRRAHAELTADRLAVPRTTSPVPSPAAVARPGRTTAAVLPSEGGNAASGPLTAAVAGAAALAGGILLASRRRHRSLRPSLLPLRRTSRR